jgi:hypothetical protein
MSKTLAQRASSSAQHKAHCQLASTLLSWESLVAPSLVIRTQLCSEQQLLRYSLAPSGPGATGHLLSNRQPSRPYS